MNGGEGNARCPRTGKRMFMNYKTTIEAKIRTLIGGHRNIRKTPKPKFFGKSNAKRGKVFVYMCKHCGSFHFGHRHKDRMIK